jgi:hypothetical protein
MGSKGSKCLEKKELYKVCRGENSGRDIQSKMCLESVEVTV